MSNSAAPVDPLLRRAFGRRARPSDPPRTASAPASALRARNPGGRYWGFYGCAELMLALSWSV